MQITDEDLAIWLQMYKIAGTIKVVPREIAIEMRDRKLVDYNTPTHNLRVSEAGEQFIKEYQNGTNQSKQSGNPSGDEHPRA